MEGTKTYLQCLQQSGWVAGNIPAPVVGVGTKNPLFGDSVDQEAPEV